MENQYYLWIIFVLLIVVVFIRKFIYIIRGRKYVPEYNSLEQVEKINRELYGSGFEFNREQEIFYSRHDAWQRKYGYRDLFDEMAPLFNMIIDCELIKFNYEGKEWMIELWKGQYGMATGGEIGIYVSKDGKNYDSVSAEDEIFMSFILMKNDKILLRRYDTHWWLTGFVLGEYSKPQDVVMVAELIFPNTEMCLSVLNSLRKLGYDKRNMRVLGNTIRLRYQKPFSKQPATRRRITSKIKMKMNKMNCKIYCKYTRRYKCTLDKIGYIKCRISRIYMLCMKTMNIWGKING